jgi:hypothetical protein
MVPVVEALEHIWQTDSLPEILIARYQALVRVEI